MVAVTALIWALAYLAAAYGQDVDLSHVQRPSEAVYPPHTLAVQFEHAPHTEQTDCLSCHPLATSSTSVGDDLLPTMEMCGDCHPQASDTSDDAACGYCHVEYLVVWPPAQSAFSARDPRFPMVGPTSRIAFRPNLIFSHVGHSEGDCVLCHADTSEGLPSLPAMEDCVACHQNLGLTTACASCHPTGEGGRLQVEFEGNAQVPTQVLRPDDHGADWLLRHGLESSLQTSVCSQCHSERDCLDCHDGAITSQSPHPPGFIGEHSAEATRDGVSCTNCHRADRFCLDCHLDVGAVDLPGQGPPLGSQYHPNGWVLQGRGGEHAFAAQRNMVECASCHAESSCLSCHTTYDPHGPGFHDRCDALLSSNPQVCLACHIDASCR